MDRLTMETLVLLLVCLGFSWGLQPGLQYRYEYSGRLVTGITEMRHQFSGAGIKAILTMQVEANRSVLIKMDNVEIGDFHDDHSCDLRDPLRIVYQPMQGGVDLLQRPFRVSLHSQDVGYLEVADDEFSWITNIRKSIVNMLPLAAIWDEIQQNSSNFTRQNFRKQEELMGGTCMNWYSVSRMSEDEAVGINLERDMLTEDVQPKGDSSSSSSGDSSGTSDVPSISDSLWTVTRSVDYDECSNLVEVKLNGHRKSDDFITRSSEALYVIRGDAQGVRLEKAVQEGSIVVFTGSEDSRDHIDTFTNQTLQLVAVSRISSKISINYAIRRDHSWRYAVENSSVQGEGRPRYYRDLKERLSGIQRSSYGSEEAKAIVFSALDDLTSESPDNLAVIMTRVVEAVSCLSVGQIDAIYNQLEDKRQRAGYMSTQEERLVKRQIHNFKVAMVLAGTEPSVKYALDLIENAVERSEYLLEALFFWHIQNTLKAPSLIPRIMRFAMEKRRNQAYPKIHAMTSTGSLVGKFCLSPDRRKTYRQSVSGVESVCDLDEVMSTFVPFLREELQNRFFSIYVLAAIQTTINLGSPISIEMLQPVIYGVKTGRVHTRTFAIAGLSAHLLPESAFNMVYNLLTPVIENKEEIPEVRSMAFLTLASWKPSMTWWKRMASSTWHDPSNEFSNIISSTIQANAQRKGELGQLASQLLYLTRPAADMSFSHSTAIYLNNFLDSEKTDQDISIIWLASAKAILPTHLSVTYEKKMLQGFSTLSTIDLFQDKLEYVLPEMRDYIDQITTGRPASDSKPIVLLKNLTESLGIKFQGYPLLPHPTIKVNDLISPQLFLIPEDFRPLSFVEHLSIFLPAPSEIKHTLHHKGTDSTLAYPTDLGLPFIVQYSSHLAFKYTENYVSWSDLPPDFPSRETWSRHTEDTLQFSQESVIATETLVPWLNSSVGSGIRNELNLRLPINIHPALYGQSLQLAIRFLPPTKQEDTIVKSVNHPYTALNKGLLLSPSIDRSGFRPIYRRDAEIIHDQRRLAPWTGIGLDSSWRGDATPSSLLRADLSCLTPSYSNWDYNITYNNNGGDTQHVSFVFTYASAKKSPAGGGPDQVFPPQSPFQEEIFTEEQNNGIAGDMVQALKHVSEVHDLVQSGQANTIGVRMSIQSSEKRNYEAAITYINDDSGERVRKNLKVNLFYDVTGRPADSERKCLNVGFDCPNILPLMTNEDVFGTNLTSTLRSELHSGTSCDGLPILDIQGNFRVTERQLNAVREKLAKRCDYNADFRVKDLITSDIYDDADMKIQWSENFPQSWRKYVRHFGDMLSESLSSSGSCDLDVVHPESVINIKASTDLTTNHVTVDSSLPQKQCKHRLLWSTFPEPLASTLTGGNARICSIDHVKIHTFDGEIIGVSPNSCWRVMAVDRVLGSYSVHVRSTSEWEAKILLEREGLHIEMTRTRFTVNGVVNRPGDEYKVIKQGNASLLILNNGLAVKVADTVEIELPSTAKSRVIGLCGTYDGEWTSERVGPKECIYRDASLFAAAWEVPGDGCDATSHQEGKIRVEEYQKHCLNTTHTPTGHVNEQDQCNTWEYKEKREGSCLCKSLAPIQVCKPGCTGVPKENEEVPFDCHRVEGPSGVDANCHLRTFKIAYWTDCKM